MKRAVIVFAVVATLLAGSPLWAKAPLHVDDDGSQWPGAYPDIETALADAVVGDTIVVHDGVYPGGINIFTDRVTLRSVGDAVLDADITPPPPGPESGSSFLALRVQAFRSNRPGIKSTLAPLANSSSISSKALQILSRNASNQAFASDFRASLFIIASLSLSNSLRQSTSLAETLPKRQSGSGG